ncbi:MAG: hypothetical protein K6F75_12405 [Butyrivibrio sp.]|nr:hypothetical protein [Butyrivibrio sp.]
MRKTNARNAISLALAAAMAMVVMTGCGSKSAQATSIPEDQIALEAEPAVGAVSESQYTSADGWSVRYNPKTFIVNEAEGMTSFVYMGESAGTNMIIATYVEGKNAEDAINEMAESYGGENPYFSQGPFPGTEDEPGYWVSFDPNMEGSGSYMTALARNYKEGALIFEVSGHNGNDEMQNMEVSDALSLVIDSLQFENA